MKADRTGIPSVVFTVPRQVAADGTVTPETALAAQTVRLESDDTATTSEASAGVVPKRKVVIFGIKDHSQLADTDVEEGYRFRYAGDNYRVVDVLETIGERQAIAEVIG